MTAAEQKSIERRPWRGAPLDGPLGRAWRTLWTALSFALFGLGAVVFGLVWFPLLVLLVRDPVRRKHIARSSVSRLFGLFIQFMGLFVLSWEVAGLPLAGGQARCVVAANHPTLIDVVFLMWLFPGADCVVKASLWRNPITMFAVRAAGYLPNDDEAYLIREASRRVAAGHCLLMFPQGTRTRPGEEPLFRRGAAVIAARAGATLVPVRIRCSPPVLRKGESWLRVPQRRSHFRIEVMERLDASRWARDGEREGTRELTRMLSSQLLDGVN